MERPWELQDRQVEDLGHMAVDRMAVAAAVGNPGVVVVEDILVVDHIGPVVGRIDLEEDIVDAAEVEDRLQEGLGCRKNLRRRVGPHGHHQERHESL